MIQNPKPGDRVLITRYIIDKSGPRPRLKGLHPIPDRGTIAKVDAVGVCTVLLDSGKTVLRYCHVATIERLTILDQIVEALDD